jgi:hypothetical protein
MKNKRIFGKKNIPLIGSIAIVLILLSATTAVPQQTSSVVVNHLDKKQQITSLFETFDSENIAEKDLIFIATFILNIANVLLKEVQNNPNDFTLTQDMILTSIPERSVENNIDNLMSQTETTLHNLKQTIDSLSRSEINSNIQSTDISLFQTILSLLTTFFKDNSLNAEGSISNLNGGILSNITNILGVIISIITFLLRAIMQSASLLISGIIKAIVALVSIILLIIGAIQTSLTIGSFFLIFLGFVSKIGLRIFSVLGAPFFALLAAQFAISSGKLLLGGITMGLLSIMALLLFFALPLLIIGGILYLSGGLDEGDDEDDGSNFDFNFNYDGTGPFYMLISVILNILNQ